MPWGPGPAFFRAGAQRPNRRRSHGLAHALRVRHAELGDMAHPLGVYRWLLVSLFQLYVHTVASLAIRAAVLGANAARSGAQPFGRLVRPSHAFVLGPASSGWIVQR